MPEIELTTQTKSRANLTTHRFPNITAFGSSTYVLNALASKVRNEH